MLKLVNASFHTASMCFSFLCRFSVEIESQKSKDFVIFSFVMFSSCFFFISFVLPVWYYIEYMFAHKTTRVGERTRKRKEKRKTREKRERDVATKYEPNANMRICFFVEGMRSVRWLCPWTLHSYQRKKIDPVSLCSAVHGTHIEVIS